MGNDHVTRWKRMRWWELAQGLSDRPASMRNRARVSAWARLHATFRLLFQRWSGRGPGHPNHHDRNPQLKQHRGVM